MEIQIATTKGQKPMTKRPSVNIGEEGKEFNHAATKAHDEKMTKPPFRTFSFGI
ncbi:MAG: hypothetical protein ACR652_22430 [Methylocystis sp.]|uniref:hypothetical protein n=1 Tax=Methylocystis sp. TaxID=1911079 RepID=UPI003DA3E63C